MTPVSSVSTTALAAAYQNKETPNSLASQEVFLHLLVAQLQNQNPLNPMDGLEFVTQLAQFSQLEQLYSIRQGIEQLTATVSAEPGV